MPLTSRPRIAGNDNGESFWRTPERNFQSIGLTLAAAAAINTVAPLICGSGTRTSNFSFSGPPYSCSTTALIAYLPLHALALQAYSASARRHQLYTLACLEPMRETEVRKTTAARRSYTEAPRTAVDSRTSRSDSQSPPASDSTPPASARQSKRAPGYSAHARDPAPAP